MWSNAQWIQRRTHLRRGCLVQCGTCCWYKTYTIASSGNTRHRLFLERFLSVGCWVARMEETYARVQNRIKCVCRMQGMSFILATTLNTVHFKYNCSFSYHNATQPWQAQLSPQSFVGNILEVLRNTVVIQHTIIHVHERLKPRLAFTNTHHISKVKNLESLYGHILDRRPSCWCAQVF